MNRISEITRRDIFDLFRNGINDNSFYVPQTFCMNYSGRLTVIDFLKRIYNLSEIQSGDSRFENVEGEIWQHTVNNPDDWPDDWIFEDVRFGLLSGSDDVFLRFIREIFHPAVRDEKSQWTLFLNRINTLLNEDGYELYPASKISGRAVYDWRDYDPIASSLFIPFSQRNKDKLLKRSLTLSISKNARNQILQLIYSYNTIERETDDTGWNYDVSTIERLFQDITQFYPPRCFDEKSHYIETNDIDKFIMSNYPYFVFDAIELYEKHCCGTDFSAKVNAILRLNNIGYQLIDGRLVIPTDVSLSVIKTDGVKESGLKELLSEANQYFLNGHKNVAVEKAWDALERLKTYYNADKKKSLQLVLNSMCGGNAQFYEMYDAEFRALTTIGNTFRIRHHETNKIDINDERQYDYFYRRCLSLISTALMYL